MRERERSSGDRLDGGLVALSVALGSFLLFQVQPLVGKHLLPWFGGGAGVWATTLVFFQVLLLAGYLYAHLVATRLSPRAQIIVHGLVLVVALAFLPVLPDVSTATEVPTAPVRTLLAALGGAVGIPYLVLAANAPLQQAWFSRLAPGRSPYRLYALSNAASLAALLSYPVVVERFFDLRTQSLAWSWAYVAFALGSVGVALRQARAGVLPVSRPETTADGWRPSVSTVAVWIGLPALASAMLLAVTNRMTQDLAPVPLLWVLPLAVYLVTFILTFDSERWYRPRPVLLALAATAFGLTAFSVLGLGDVGVAVEGGLLLAALFLIGMLCHGEVVRLKPPPARLTTFYLAVALGGAVGGATVALAAPVLFDRYREFEIGLALACAAAVVFLGREYTQRGGVRARAVTLLASVVALVSAAGLVAALVVTGSADGRRRLHAERNFYGAVRVVETRDTARGERREMVHGRIVHGTQFTDPARRTTPTSYYGPLSGIGLAAEHHRLRLEGTALDIGVVGLGTGTLAAYARPGDHLVFYEIDPDVVDVARDWFWYLADAEDRGVRVETRLGDARIVLASETPQAYDLLVVDAFSGDAIPVHLLTREAFELYRTHLAPGGVLAVHVSNSYLDLVPVIEASAAAVGMEAALVVNEPIPIDDVVEARWTLVTDDREWLGSAPVRSRVQRTEGAPLLWTDVFSSLVPLLALR